MDGTNECIVVRNLNKVTVAVTDGEWEGTTDSINEGVTLDKVNGTKDGNLDESNDGEEEGVLKGSKDDDREKILLIAFDLKNNN